MTDLTAIILTKDEELNISDCISSIKNFAKRIIIIDSGSTDKTVELAKALGADIYYHPFKDYASQFNWGIDNTNISTKWTLRLDADERFTPELCEELQQLMQIHEFDDVNGISMEAWFYFMGRRFTHGRRFKHKLMIFKTGIGRVENRKMDEHTLLMRGTVVKARNKFLHYDFKDINSYVKKLNWYATREMQDYFENRFPDERISGTDKAISRLRHQKTKYYKAPMFIRCWLYFFYAFFIRGNFLNGREGRIYSFLYHLYYRMLVDAKIYEQIKNPKPFEETGDLK